MLNTNRSIGHGSPLSSREPATLIQFQPITPALPEDCLGQGLLGDVVQFRLQDGSLEEQLSAAVNELFTQRHAFIRGQVPAVGFNDGLQEDTGLGEGWVLCRLDL